MLGAEVIVTGFSADAAQTLVKLDINLSGMITRGTLREGFAEALHILKRRVAVPA
jgi:rsbT co-antagonist protein RsbR